MIPNLDPNLRILVSRRDAEGEPELLRLRIVAWEENDLGPFVVSARGDLVRASQLGVVRGVEGRGA